MATDRKNNKSVEVWAGVECTINRVGNNYFDQLLDAGCYDRTGDIERLAEAGVRNLRFPILWEKHEPVEHQSIDWAWADGCMEEIRKSGIRPVIGLVHHGSGPAFTDLSDDTFPQRLANYARKVAVRYPWVDRYTPVNEPLTTARFSGLYGLWYPHARDKNAFCRMLVNQLKAVVLCMQEIRKVNPAAQLVQTEDLARVHSTAPLFYQRDFENERRWLSYDLLCGMVNEGHALYNYLLESGITEEELSFFLSNPCPPDIAGFNYYVTSERYLDHRLEDHVLHTHGGNGKDCYADIEAVRVGKAAGVKYLLREAWERYHLPMALTEVHLGCTREEQLRWFRDLYEAGKDLLKEAIDIRAVTLWSAYGSFDWNSLLTQKAYVYEQGAFDVRSSVPRKTALAAMLSDESREKIWKHPALEGHGWWRHHKTAEKKDRRPLMILGATGTLGSAFSRICACRNLHCISLTRKDVDIRNKTELERLVKMQRPWAVINATGYVHIDQAENDPASCFAINTEACASIAAVCARYDTGLVSFSSDQVFGGEKLMPYTETDETMPLNVYGRSKAMAEEQLGVIHPDALVIRTSAFFGPWDRYNFAWNVLQQLNNSGRYTVTDTGVVSPTYVPDLVNAALDLLLDGEHGIWHLSNRGAISWHEFARLIAERNGHKAHVISMDGDKYAYPAKRPSYSALSSERGIILPMLDKAIEHFFAQSCC